jgi:hypothetical protein
MALSADKQKREMVGNEETYPVAASAKIYANAMCVLDNSGYANELTAAGGRFIGHAVAQVDNSSGIAAAKDVTVKRGRYRRQETLTGVAITDVGRPVYASDDATLTLTPASSTTIYPMVGIVCRYVTTNTAVVEFRSHEWAEGEVMLTDMVKFFDDFLGNNVLTSEAIWKLVDVGDATEAGVAATHMGEIKLAIAATDEAEDAVLYMGDALPFDIDKLKRVRFRAAFATPGTGVTCVVGMGGAHNLDKDTMAQNAWFRCEAGLACKCESDDGTTDNDDKTAATIVTGQYYIFEIDFTTPAAVKFYIDGTAVATGTTFDMSAYTAGLQFYASADKTSGTGVGSISIDWVEITCER